MSTIEYAVLFVIAWATIALIVSLFYCLGLQLGKRGIIFAIVVIVLDVLTLYVLKIRKKYLPR